MNLGGVSLLRNWPRRRCTAACFPSVVLLALLAIASGCSTTKPYQYGRYEAYNTSPRLAARNIEPIERGEERPVLDAVGWVIGIPSKIILWDSRVDNHKISYRTEAAIAEYLAANELHDVKVRLNQYSPGDEWKRLVANDAVGPGWRYTIGTLSVLGYTLLPGRLLGGDNYNPFTNTINIYSDVPAIGLHEGGHAKDFAQRKWKGTYAAGYVLLPVFPLYPEAIATRDAIAYLQEHGSPEEEREGYLILYPAFGTYVGGAVGEFVGPPLYAYAGGILVGHAAGRLRANQVHDVEPWTVEVLEEGAPSAIQE
jgi:hypothetical protein